MKNKLSFAITIMVLAAAISVAVISCKKEQQHTPSDEEQVMQNVLEGQEAIEQIVNFRNQFETYKKNPDTKTVETVSLEEAVWNIENLFNLSYSMPEKYYSEMANFVFRVGLPIDTAGQVRLSDLFDMYDQAVAQARTEYANDGFTNKGFVFMRVNVDLRSQNLVQLVFKGKTGEVAMYSIGTPYHDTMIIDGPFGTLDDWEYKSGWGKCNDHNCGSGADKELQHKLHEYLISTLAFPETGYRAVYLNSVEVFLDGISNPNDVFYRENTNASCIDHYTMNSLFSKEKRLIFRTIPNSSNWNVYGYTPIVIEIDGKQKYNPSEETQCITHENTLTYAQRTMASIYEIGETRDLLNE